MNRSMTPVDVLIKAQVKELRLPTVGVRFAELAQQAARDGQPHADYLASLGTRA